jgi:DMSO/TMAO reductase YedYZ molybdopterin-dependent catalytic subunit
VTISLQREATSASVDDDLWCPTPLAALEFAEIPSALHFVRDHFSAPSRDPESWSLELTGGDRSLELDLDMLRSLPRRALRVVLECAGHRRVEFESAPRGIPWAAGAVAEARWTGTSLAGLLELIGIPTGAREVVLEGADAGPVDGFDGAHRFARSLPLAKALDHDVLLAYEMNGEPIPGRRGGPVRAIVPGWYATDSVKWLDRVWLTDDEFAGVFQAHDYRLREPGEHGAGRRMTELPVHALITTPSNAQAGLRAGNLSVRGIAWGGTRGVAAVHVRIDSGPWTAARLRPARGTYARVPWETQCRLTPGAHEIACRAIDGAGRSQPDRPPTNLRGYGNNAIHQIRFRTG